MSQSNEARSLSRPERRIIAVLRAAHYGGMVLVMGMMLLTVAHAVGRYAFSQPIPGVVELSCFMQITAIFLIIAYTAALKGHISIGIFVDRFSARTQAIIDSFTYIICLVVAIVALWQSFVRGIYIMQTGQATTVLHIPNFPFIYIVGVGWGLFSLAILMHLVHFLLRAVKKSGEMNK